MLFSAFPQDNIFIEGRSKDRVDCLQKPGMPSLRWSYTSDVIIRTTSCPSSMSLIEGVAGARLELSSMSES